ncbi:MAG: cyclic nucleotide-binding domain-containing protein [Candidatus Brocadiaceae bacterium]|nr:cyclic nucleotide-binding domain-containing protein [Candidatus Brocadiaceae bacterium]
MTEETSFFKQKRDFLKNYEPFSLLSNNLLKKIISKLNVVSYGVGQTICERGHKGNCLFVIHTGSVVETLIDSSGEEITVSILSEGDCFGTISLIKDESYLATIKSREDVELFVLNNDDIRELIQKDPVLSMYLSRIATMRMKKFFDFFEKEKIKVVEVIEEKSEKERKLDVINRVTKLVLSAQDINKTLLLVVKAVNKEMRADACSIYLVDRVSNDLVLEAAVGFDDRVIQNVRMRLDEGEGVTGWVVENGEPVALEDVHTDPRVKFITEIHEERLSSLLSVPLGDKKNVIGAINIQTVDLRKYTYDDIRGLTIMANHIALAISHARLKKRIQIAEGMGDRKVTGNFGFVGKGKYVDKINTFVDSMASVGWPVLISGENGTGKIQMSKIIHYKSKRYKGPFVEIDCRDIENESWGEEIFGHEKNPDISSSDVSIERDPQGNTSLQKSVEDGDISTRLGYIELADSGTIFLNHVDELNQANQIKLLNYMQEGRFNRVNGNDTIFSNARIIVSVSKDIVLSIEKGEFDKNLHKILSKNYFQMKTLRDQKRSIPMLAKHFLEKISRDLHKDVKNVSDDAMGRLMSYNWPGNVVEFENVLRRSVILAKGDVITPEQIFFGIPIGEKKWSFDILSYDAVKGFLKSKFYPLGLQVFSSIVLVITLFMLLLGHKDGLLNFTNIIFWSTGLFGMYLVTFFSGRLLCGICPFAAAGDLVRRLKNYNLQVPKLLVSHGKYITIGFILFVFWFEGVTSIPRSSALTAYLIMFILLGAIVSGFIFERRVWCRYVCPLGGLLGVYSFSSITSLRANRSVCLNKCETHDCYLGTRATKGCPMYLHPYGLENNRDCVLCMNCYKNCGHSSIRVNLQIPGSDISYMSNRSLSESLLCLSLLGILLVEYGSLLSVDSQWFQILYSFVGINQTVLYTLIFAFVSLLPIGSIGFLDFVSNGFSFDNVKERIADFGYAAVPLALMGHLAFYWNKLKVTFREFLEITSIYKPERVGNDILIDNKIGEMSALELLFILAGFAGSIYVFCIISKKSKYVLTKSTIVGYFVVFAIFVFAFIYTIAP